MSDKKTNGSAMFAPFNIISMKDVKDKTTKSKGLRPLFGCIESIQESVEDIREFLTSGPDEDERALCEDFLKQLTDMQVKLIELSKSKVTAQNLAPIDQMSTTPPVAKLQAAPAAPVTSTEPPKV